MNKTKRARCPSTKPSGGMPLIVKICYIICVLSLIILANIALHGILN